MELPLVLFMAAQLVIDFLLFALWVWTLSKLYGLNRPPAPEEEEERVGELKDSVSQLLIELEKGAARMVRDMERRKTELEALTRAVMERETMLEEELQASPRPRSKPGRVVESSAKTAPARRKILQLHSQGRSIDQIAQTLNMGKGEVDLIIGLYNASRKKRGSSGS